MSNGIEMVCEMGSEDSDWSDRSPLPAGMTFERLKFIDDKTSSKTDFV
jgi:hypothetical protein